MGIFTQSYRKMEVNPLYPLSVYQKQNLTKISSITDDANSNMTSML